MDWVPPVAAMLGERPWLTTIQRVQTAWVSNTQCTPSAVLILPSHAPPCPAGEMRLATGIAALTSLRRQVD